MKVKLYALAIVLVLAAGMFFYFGDSAKGRLEKANNKFGIAMDPQRTALAIPPIPKGLQGYLLDETSLSWNSPGGEGQAHLEKTVVFTSDLQAPVAETDCFQCKNGRLEVKSTYGDNGKTLAAQEFRLNGKPLSAEEGRGLLKKVLAE